jgi:hypothetical protein
MHRSRCRIVTASVVRLRPVRMGATSIVAAPVVAGRRNVVVTVRAARPSRFASAARTASDVR